MIGAAEALNLVLQHQLDTGSEKVSLHESVGRVVAEDVFADRDFPPYNRVMMDGVAIQSTVYYTGIRTFAIEAVQAAGTPQTTLQDKLHCIEVMTGAVLPGGTDLVIPYEQCNIQQGVVTILATNATPMQHVHLRGTDGKSGSLLIPAGTRITPAVIGLLATVGKSQILVVRFPRVTICSTGDELIDIDEQPATHQVRRSNVYMLAAALAAEGIKANTIHLPDDPVEMSQGISALLKSNDVILFSGAVSKGRYDHLPAVLSALAIETIFHTVAQRPGKPFLFGKSASGPIIFGFPGNPVSTFACYHQFFKKWLHKLLQITRSAQVQLGKEVRFTPALTHHLLVNVQNVAGALVAMPVIGSTSGDLVTLAQANGIITLPPEREVFHKGEVFEVNLLH